MTPAQAKKAYRLLTEVQLMLGDLPKGKAIKAYNKICKVKFHIKKSNAMKVRVYSDMCPYCEEEVEFYDLRDQQCPYCGLHFTPAQDSYYEDVGED